MSLSTDLCRLVLREVTADMRKHLPAIKLKDAWVWECGKDHWEFHYKDFYWQCTADNAYEARSKGYSALLSQAGIEGYKV